MKIFIQGRKDGYNTLYPKPTPTEFFQFASDIQRIDAQNNSQYYGKSLYSIAFNGIGCIFTKYIVGYDTLRSNIGNIGISVFIPNNQRMLGADIKTLLDELIKIYTTNYCPDFKINNQKQEDWLLFSSYANNFDSKVKIDSADENFIYGGRDAAYVLYGNDKELEKYLEAPYQTEFKEYKQILFVDNQSRLLLEVIKHDQTETANLTGKIDLDNPSFKLREYHGQAKNNVSIEIRAEGRLRNNKDKIFRKDIVTIKYSKKYHMDIFEKGNLSDPQIAKYLKLFDNAIDVEKNIELKPAELPIEIRICNSKGDSITDASITCKNDYSKIEKQVSQNTIIFSGDEQKDRWIISAKKYSFTGEVKIIPENESTIKLNLREEKIITLKVFDEKGFELPKHCKVIPFYDDEIRIEQSIPISVSSYHTKFVTFIPKDKDDPIVINLERKINQSNQPQNKLSETHSQEIPKSENKSRSLILYTLFALIIFFITGIGYYFRHDIFGNQDPSYAFQNNKKNVKELPKLNGSEIERYVEGDSLILDTLYKYKTDWEMLTPVIENVTSNDSNSTAEKQDSTEIKNWKKIDESLDRAIKKRVAINECDFGFFKDNNNKIIFPEAQLPLKRAINKINENVKLGDVSQLTLTQIADSINKYIEASNEKNSNVEEDNSQKKKSNPKSDNNKPEIKKSVQTPEKNKSTEENKIIEYLKGSEFSFKQLTEYERSNTSEELKPSITLALKFWSLDGLNQKTYFTYFSNVKKDKYLKNNNILKDFLKNEIAKKENKYPQIGRAHV